jgi:hypothetical protein
MLESIHYEWAKDVKSLENGQLITLLLKSYGQAGFLDEDAFYKQGDTTIFESALRELSNRLSFYNSIKLIEEQMKEEMTPPYLGLRIKG